MRALVTGAGGFVGAYLCRTLADAGDEVYPADRSREGMLPLDLGDPENLRGLLEFSHPDVVYHLAAQAFVPESIARPIETFTVNALGTANLVDAMRVTRDDGNAGPRLIMVSSADVYGERSRDEYPLRETVNPHPPNPYAASKIAAEAFSLAAYRTFGIPVIVARPFNHIGAGQSDRFAVSSFALQLARIADGAPPILHTGNLGTIRDFLDVRDVVAAYRALAVAGEPGQTYNVARGEPVEVRTVLRALIEIARVPVEVREDEGRLRPPGAGVSVSYGDATKLRNATGWAPSIPLRQTLREVYERARATVAT